MNNFALPQPAISPAMIKATKDNRGGSFISDWKRGMHAIDNRCVTCGLPTWIDVMPEWATPGDKAEAGHVIPASEITPEATTNGQRGGYTHDNIVLQCADCNGGMGAERILFVEYIPSYYMSGTYPRKGKPAASVSRADVKRQTRLARGLAA